MKTTQIAVVGYFRFRFPFPVDGGVQEFIFGA
jgi:hypothetical protein